MENLNRVTLRSFDTDLSAPETGGDHGRILITISKFWTAECY